jgi:formylglycine-generating enzyme required for sulfatase activity
LSRSRFFRKCGLLTLKTDADATDAQNPSSPAGQKNGIPFSRIIFSSMSILIIFCLTAMMVAGSGCSTGKGSRSNSGSHPAPDNLVFVKGGTFKNVNSTNYYGKSVFLSSFYIGKYEVTQKEWMEIMESNPSQFQGDHLPVEMVTWYECVEYCNRRSLKEGLKPYYRIDKNKTDPDNENENDDIKWTVTIDTGANGYRLPTEAEWEYAAGGGQKSQSYIYSGGNDVDTVAWYWQNSGDTKLTGFWSWPVIEQNHGKTHSIGGKEPNELGLYDMSGNVREWCWDWYGDLESVETWKVVENDPQGSSHGSLRVWRGGGWLGGDFCCALSFRVGYEQYDRGSDQGLRVCRSQ